MKPILALVLAAALAGAPAAGARAQEAPKTYDMRDATPEAMQVWIKDPNLHAFYQATIDAFAMGPDHLDRPAYEKRSHEIFRALAAAHGMPPDALEDHLKGIPGEMIQIVTRDPKTLDTYDNFILALFGPQKWPG
ncbi:MAG: hypothetical protein ACXU82_10885 [Caulobacteraceae bacterium]